MRWNYSLRQLGGDIAGGTTAALIALPYGLAMASLMGLPPVLGLFTSLLTAPITAVLGRNPVLIGGTASATVPFIALAVQGQGIGGAAKVCLATSVFMMAFCVLRLGRHLARVPHSVVAGFSCGIGGLMIVAQLRTIAGIASPVDAVSSNAAVQLWHVISMFDQMRPYPVLLAGIVVTVSFAAARWMPRSPAPLLGVIAACAGYGLTPGNERVVGSLPLQLPDFAGFVWRPSDVYTVLPSAMMLAFVASVNIVITSRVVEHFRGRHRPLRAGDADRELGAYGIANVCAGIFGAPLSVGIPARSIASVRCGATTRVTIIAHALVLFACLRFGGGALAQVPMAALAGVTVYIGICLLDWGTWRRLRVMKRSEAAAFLVTAACVLLVNAVAAVAVGYALHLAWEKRHAMRLLQPATAS
jgi:sulfate permease, SulP family